MVTRYAISLALFCLVGNVAIGMDLASVKESMECGGGLMCSAVLEITQDPSKPPAVSAGFEISSNVAGSIIGEETKRRIAKNTPFTYKRLAVQLIEKVKPMLEKYNCSISEDMVADSILKAASTVARNCMKTGDEACKSKQSEYKCGEKSDMPPPSYPWEAVLGSVEEKDFDKDPSNFDIFYNLLKDAKLADMLVDAKNITVLAPCDMAFAKSAAYIAGYTGDMKDERMIYEAYKNQTKDSMKIGPVEVEGIDVMRFLLAYHVVGGKHSEKAFEGVPKYRLTSATVPVLSVKSELVDLSPDTPNAQIDIGDINVNGDVLVHSVDTVLLPFEMKFDMENLLNCPAKQGSIGVATMPQSAPQTDGMPPKTTVPPAVVPAAAVPPATVPVIDLAIQEVAKPTGIPSMTDSKKVDKQDAAKPTDKPPITIFTPKKEEKKDDDDDDDDEDDDEKKKPCVDATGKFILVIGTMADGVFEKLCAAKEKLNLFKADSTVMSRAIFEIKDGKVIDNPAMVGGQNQAKGEKAGFHAYWKDEADLKKLHEVAEKFWKKEQSQKMENEDKNPELTKEPDATKPPAPEMKDETTPKVPEPTNPTVTKQEEKKMPEATKPSVAKEEEKKMPEATKPPAVPKADPVQSVPEPTVNETIEPQPTQPPPAK